MLEIIVTTVVSVIIAVVSIILLISLFIAVIVAWRHTSSVVYCKYCRKPVRHEGSLYICDQCEVALHDDTWVEDID